MVLPTRRRAAPAIRRLPLPFVLAFVVLNSVFLLYFLLPHHDYPSAPAPPLRHHSSLKPWPLLPSFIPWSHPSSPAPRSCEAFFGHGFSRPVLPLRGPIGWFRCHHNPTLRSSICEGGHLRMDPRRISMSRGGEDLLQVMGRSEGEELPTFLDGAFEIAPGGEGGSRKPGEKLVDEGFLDEYVPQGGVGRHTMRELIGGIKVAAGELQCDQWIDEPTLLVTRFEYANMFHTVTDWYSAYVSSRVINLSQRPKVVFVDGHCKAQLEQTWQAMFSGLTYAKNFTGTVCFRHAILSPLGYETAMFKGLSETFKCHGAAASDLRKNPNDHKTARLSEFGEMLRASFNLPTDDKDIKKPVSGHNILFVRREDYLAHPRHDGKVQSRLSNEKEVFDSLQDWANGHTGCRINLVNGLFAHMPLKDQLQAIQEASVVIGAHGAGLTHLVSARSDTVVLEIISSFYKRPHFQLISDWKGLTYHAINLAGSYAEPQVVVNQLTSIMQTLGC